MRWAKTVTMVEAHAEGEVGRVVTGGVIDVPGATMADKLTYINEADDSLRRFLVFEPRGAAQMSTILIFPPTRPDADIGFLILQGDKAHAMSGSQQHLPRHGAARNRHAADGRAGNHRADRHRLRAGHGARAVPQRQVRAGDAEDEPELRARARRDARCRRAYGKVKLDISYGGIFYALIDAAQFGLEIQPETWRKKLVEIGTAMHRAVNAQLDIRHPEIEAIRGISYTMFIGRNAAGELKGATIMAAGPDRPLALRHRQFRAARRCRRRAARQSSATGSPRARSSTASSRSSSPRRRRSATSRP